MKYKDYLKEVVNDDNKKDKTKENNRKVKKEE